MSINIKTTKRTRKIQVSLDDHLKIHQSAISGALHEIGAITVKRNKLLINSGKKTGRVYHIKGRAHQASAPGEAPATITGRLAESVSYVPNGPYTLVVGQTASYAEFLESGTRNILPRPNVIRAVNETARDAVNIFYRYAQAGIDKA